TFHNGVEYEKKASPKERTKTGSLNYLCPRNSKSGDLAVFMKEALYFYITYYLKNKRKLESIGWITPHQLQNKKCQLIIRSIKVDCANFSNQLRKKHK
ncbi:hypothetical protein JW935_01270, partial [candidate division KSB1 bacterium]|nr:hypothetical protein [candidate division KSB1 bacterium]